MTIHYWGKVYLISSGNGHRHRPKEVQRGVFTCDVGKKVAKPALLVLAPHPPNWGDVLKILHTRTRNARISQDLEKFFLTLSYFLIPQWTRTNLYEFMVWRLGWWQLDLYFEQSLDCKHLCPFHQIFLSLLS